ncbi:hypothetical protein [Streptomyces sp. NPDC093589]|uniref:hypothetical protein n=1 Tax=Streptomyces sp. NPDC093589 TaxID=3366043 RepID=UPI00380E0006
MASLTGSAIAAPCLFPGAAAPRGQADAAALPRPVLEPFGAPEAHRNRHSWNEEIYLLGYTTDFTGTVTVAPPLNADEIAYLRKFADTRRMARERGPYFVDGTGPLGQGNDPDVVDGNRPPAGQPGLWCEWVPTDDGAGIEWSGTEKFYDADAWMRYVIDHFLRPGAHAQGQPGFERFTFDHTVDGEIEAQGEYPDDQWTLYVTNNTVTRT